MNRSDSDRIGHNEVNEEKSGAEASQQQEERREANVRLGTGIRAGAGGCLGGRGN